MQRAPKLLVEGGDKLHIVAPGGEAAYCGRPLAGNGQYGHPWRKDLTPAPWYGDGDYRQRTVADLRTKWGLCKRCAERAGV